jgi:hypothetical protein
MDGTANADRGHELGGKIAERDISAGFNHPEKGRVEIQEHLKILRECATFGS